MPSADFVARAENAILILLHERAPNSVSGVIIKARLREYDDATINSAFASLAGTEITASGGGTGPVEQTYYGLPNYANIPIRRFIRIGDTEIPRVTADTPVNYFPENFNEAVERLAEYTAGRERRFEEMFTRQLRDYWATLVAVFGVFVAVLAFVIVGLPKIETNASATPGDIFLTNLAQVGPVALVLALFVIVLRIAIRYR